MQPLRHEMTTWHLYSQHHEFEIRIILTREVELENNIGTLQCRDRGPTGNGPDNGNTV